MNEREDLYDLVHSFPLARASALVSAMTSYPIRTRIFGLIPASLTEGVFEVTERGVTQEVPRRLWSWSTVTPLAPLKIDDAHSIIWGQVVRDV